MSERELLEKAARACGLDCVWQGDGDFINQDDKLPWNCLTNSGDCAEMNAQLNIDTYWRGTNNSVDAAEVNDYGTSANYYTAMYKDHSNDRSAAWRYASTVVAAQMGEKP